MGSTFKLGIYFLHTLRILFYTRISLNDLQNFHLDYKCTNNKIITKFINLKTCISKPGLLDICIMYLFTFYFKHYNALLAIKTNFLLFVQNTKKVILKKLRAFIFL